MSDLIEFLLARIDEDEQAARPAAQGSWRFQDMQIWAEPTRRASHDVLVVKHTWPQEAAHITRWNPSRTLADCAARRAIIELHAEKHAQAVADAETNFSPYKVGYVAALHKVLVVLAQPHAAHPDFNPAWRLQG